MSRGCPLAKLPQKGTHKKGPTSYTTPLGHSMTTVIIFRPLAADRPKPTAPQLLESHRAIIPGKCVTRMTIMTACGSIPMDFNALLEAERVVSERIALHFEKGLTENMMTGWHTTAMELPKMLGCLGGGRGPRSTPSRDACKVEHLAWRPKPAHYGDGVWLKLSKWTDLPEELRYLPRVQQKQPAELHVPFDGYWEAVQTQSRKAGGFEAGFQKASKSTVSMPHIDRDNQGRTPATYISMRSGAHVIIAWAQSELNDEDITDSEFRNWPTMLKRVASYTVLFQVAGETVRLAPAMVHFIITLSDKEQLVWHVYE